MTAFRGDVKDIENGKKLILSCGVWSDYKTGGAVLGRLEIVSGSSPRG